MVCKSHNWKGEQSMKEFYIADDGIQLHAKLDVPEEKEKCPLVGKRF